MPGDFGAPYRAPCGGWPASRQWFLGRPYQHRVAAHAAVSKLVNSTLVADYLLAEDPNFHVAGIPPFPRTADGDDWPVSENCPEGDCTGAAGTVPCNEWPAGERSANAFTADGTIDLSACRKLGWKGVQARKAWVGRFGFLSHDPAGLTEPMDAGCANCEMETEQPTADTTKFRTVRRRIRVREYLLMSFPMGAYPCDFSRNVWVDPSGAAAQDYVRDQTWTVDRYSGVVTTTVNESSGDYESLSLLAQGRVDAWLCAFGNSIRQADIEANTRDDKVSDGTCPFIWTYQSLDPVANDHFAYLERAFDTTTGGYKLEAEAWLSEAYTSEALWADIVTLLGYWNLTDDAQLPWRLDGYCSITPLVSFNEVGPVNPDCKAWGAWTDPLASDFDGAVKGAPMAAGYRGYFDYDHQTIRSCLSDTAEIVHYIYKHGAYSAAIIPTAPVGDGTDRTTGDPTDGVVTACARQWTENWDFRYGFHAGELPDGAWAMHRSGMMVAQKWAEILVPRPSLNLARPCGVDRYKFDEPTVRCVRGVSGDPIVLEVAESTGLATDDVCLVWGAAGVTNGVYEITVTGSTTIELTTGLPLPAAFTAPENVGTGIVGKLRWYDRPPICGRIGIGAAVQDGAQVVLTTEATHLLVAGDMVTLTGVAGLVGSLAVVSAVDGTHFRVTGTLSGAYVSGGFVASTGAASYEWNDDQRKGQFLQAIWEFNFRDYVERDRVVAQYGLCASCEEAEPANSTAIRMAQEPYVPRYISGLSVEQKCLSFTPCCPQVACISPNGETFANGYRLDMPALVADDRYGSQWQAAFIQHIEDPFWQVPHEACVADGVLGNIPDPCAQEEDAGGCAEDDCEAGAGTRYFAQRPWVEAMADVPAGAPALPTGTDIHIATWAEIQTGSPTGAILLPPEGAGYADGVATTPNEHATPWGLYLAQLQCVCAEGRFAAQYAANGVLCL